MIKNYVIMLSLMSSIGGNLLVGWCDPMDQDLARTKNLHCCSSVGDDRWVTLSGHTCSALDILCKVQYYMEKKQIYLSADESKPFCHNLGLLTY